MNLYFHVFFTDIDVESISSVSDGDEDSSLSDSDYIIVPLPDCFDINKPLTRSMMSLILSIFMFFFTDIDVESISSVSDDDEDSSLSDSDYIIVPLPDCFDINKPLTRSMMSSFTSSVERGPGSEDNNNTLSVGRYSQ